MRHIGGLNDPHVFTGYMTYRVGYRSTADVNQAASITIGL
jgi:hypothetical protein